MLRHVPEKIVAAFESSDFTKTFFHGHSYTANPIACAAANASFDLLMKEECRLQMTMINKLHEAFRTRIQVNAKVKEVRCLGTILAIELRSDDESSYSNDLRKKIYPFFLERDILLRPLGNVIYVLPPYVIQEAELNKIYSAIDGIPRHAGIRLLSCFIFKGTGRSKHIMDTQLDSHG